jgi:hypothetical protein
MSIFYLANVPCIQSERGINFYTPHNHVAVYYPADNSPSYMVWDYFRDGKAPHDKAFFGSFVDAMDKASEWLKRAEPA